MALKIETFSNVAGGNSFFKAIGHPLAAPRGRDLVSRLAAGGPVAVYDPNDMAAPFAEFFDLSSIDVTGVFVQNVEKIGSRILGRNAEPVTALATSSAATVFVAAFDADRLIDHVRHLLPPGADVVTLDHMRLPDEMLTVSRTYLSPLNFATNFAFFRDGNGHHTRVVTANYWGGYGARETRLWLCLFDASGEILVHWTEDAPSANGTIAIDSRDVRQRFGLPAFTGQLFIHVVGAAGHDVVKYALDTYGDDPGLLSCTHDANAWPADLYAGLPAPKPDEKVILWVQNSHPVPIPARSVGLNLMGRNAVSWLDREIPPFGSHPLDVADLLPDARWPEQIEIRAGKHFVRPRYEIVSGGGRLRIAHPNVERVDLRVDEKLPDLTGLFGKGFILPAPILPTDRYRSIVLPTPMSTAQTHLPIVASVFDHDGREVAVHRFGNLRRDESVDLDVSALLAEAGITLPRGYGHVELRYDFAVGSVADGWLHGLFRYEDARSGHGAETSFGAHIFNTALTYRGEPQSYTGRPPGLSTRLFLRLGPEPLDTLCHLVYPASTPWHAASDTTLVLTDRNGGEVARRRIAIACGGSFLFRYRETFTDEERAAAGPDAYILVRDTTCRLFGYHGLASDEGAFSLDHMFGF